MARHSPGPAPCQKAIATGLNEQAMRPGFTAEGSNEKQLLESSGASGKEKPHVYSHMHAHTCMCVSEGFEKQMYRSMYLDLVATEKEHVTR